MYILFVPMWPEGRQQLSFSLRELVMPRDNRTEKPLHFHHAMRKCPCSICYRIWALVWCFGAEPKEAGFTLVSMLSESFGRADKTKIKSKVMKK